MLKGDVTGSNLRLVNTALRLVVEPGNPPMTINSAKKERNHASSSATEASPNSTASSVITLRGE